MSSSVKFALSAPVSHRLSGYYISPISPERLASGAQTPDFLVSTNATEREAHFDIAHNRLKSPGPVPKEGRHLYHLSPATEFGTDCRVLRHVRSYYGKKV
jgi:hypothetical protein